MFNISFGRKKTQTPLSDLKSISSWMDNLSLRDNYAAHAEILQKLNEFNEIQDFSAERLAVLMFLDESSQTLQHALCKQYLLSPRMSKSTECKLWEAIRQYYLNMTKSYHGFIMDYVSHPDDNPWADSLPLLTSRAMRYFSQEVKWHYFRYEPPEPRTWKHIHNLYRFAEFQEIHTKSVTLYETAAPVTNCAREYVAALMLNQLGSGTLYPRQIELASEWLTNWSSDLVLEQRYDASRHGFFVDFADDKAARRIRNYVRDPMKRYWSTSAFTQTLTQHKTALQKGDPQARIKLGEDCKLPGCLTLLDHVIAAWSQSGIARSPRKHARVAAKKVIDVVQGFAQIQERIKEDNALQVGRQDVPLSYDEALDVKMYGFITTRTLTRRNRERQSEAGESGKGETAERWVMENESEQGFGAVVKEKNNDWLKPGALVGLKVEKHKRWVVGVIRRMQKIVPDQFYVGIEVICIAPVVVELRELPQAAQPQNDLKSPVTLPFLAIYAPKEDGARKGASLLLRNVEYAKGRKLEVTARTKSYRIALAEAFEKNHEWTRSGIEILAGAQH